MTTCMTTRGRPLDFLGFDRKAFWDFLTFQQARRIGVGTEYPRCARHTVFSPTNLSDIVSTLPKLIPRDQLERTMKRPPSAVSAAYHNSTPDP